MAEPTLFTNLRKVITLIDRLRDLGLQKYISLPRIAVVGTQSSGKSSLLEQIVGLDFLPRGSGVVTRRPLELRLVNTSGEKISKPKAKFEEIPDKEFTDFQIVKKTIEELTDKVCGSKKGIIDKPILLTIYSNTCPDLTLIDLPGITRIPLNNSDQPQDIEQITKNMAKRYIDDEATCILCVIPANQDISTSDGLLMARNSDPKGQRTIGVITKIDIMDKGVNAKSLLLGQDIPLRLGYVGVICRSQEDINKNKLVSAHLADEQKFFSSHPVYSTLRKGTVGTDSLIKTLTEVLYGHIRSFLPALQKLIQEQIRFKENRLKELGPSLPETENEKMKYLWQTINDFIIQFKNTINGTYSKQNHKRDSQPAGSKIRMTMQELFEDQINNKICNKYKDDDIKRAIMLHEGHSIPGFPSIDAFMALLIPKLKEMKVPAQECIQEVYNILDNEARKILKKVCEKVPELLNDLQEKIIQHIHHEKDKASKLIDNIIDSEIGYVFTNDVEYLTERGKVKKGTSGTILHTEDQNAVQLTQKQSNQLDQQQVSGNPLVQELRNRIDDYFYVVLRGLRDTIPKLVGNFLVRASHEKMRYVLFEAIRSSKDMFKLMEEPQHIVEERKELKKAVQTLQQSKEMIKMDPDLSVMANTNILEQQEEQKPKPPTKKANNMFEDSQQVQKPVQQQQIEQPKVNQPVNNTKPQQQAGGMKGLFGLEENDINKPKQNPNTNNAQNPQQLQKQTSQGQNQQQQQQPPQQKPVQQQQQQPQQQNPQSQQNNKPVQQQPQSQQNQKEETKDQNKDVKKNNMFGTSTKNDMFGTTNIANKVVDNAMQNPQVQKGIQDAAKNTVTNIVENQIPIKNAEGKNIIAEQAGNMAQKAVQNEQVQKAISDGAKQGLQQGAQQAQQEAKKGLFKW